MENATELIKISKRKLDFDKKNNWSKGSQTYFDELQKEIQEAQEENKENNSVRLEDELGDIFWDYINLLVNLEDEKKIILENVFQRAVKKYEERISGIENNISWDEIKKKQKEQIKKEINDNISKVHIREGQKKHYYSWQQIEQLIKEKLPEIKKENYENIYGIPRGGLIIATILCYQLNLPIILDKEKITHKTLIVDDICDSGKTLKELSQNDTFVVFHKKEAQITPTYYSKIINQETWIVFPWEE